MLCLLLKLQGQGFLVMALDLQPGQYQIGDFVFGEKTLFRVESFDPGGYDVNIQDFQATVSDEFRFGQDALKPLPIQITINAFVNSALPNIMAISPPTGPMNFESDPTVGQFVREWRSDSIRKTWGELKPLHCCRPDGSIVSIYGRPGKLSVTKRPVNGTYHKIVAEFRRADSLVYNEFEWYLHCRPQEIVTVGRSEDLGMGNAPAWMRFWIVGPADHPIIQWGNMSIDLDVDISAGEIVEISSYPWQRRVVGLSDGITYNSRLNSPFLDQIKFPEESAFEVSWNATNTNTTVTQVVFDNYTPGNLPSSDWDVTYDYVGRSGSIQVGTTNVGWADSGTDNKFGFCRYKLAQTLTDYQLTGFTMASPAELSLISEDCVNRIIGRGNATLSEYSYWDITYEDCWFGIHQNGIDTRISKKFRIATIWERIWQLLQDFFEGEVPGNNWDYEAEFGQGSQLRSHALRINNKIVARYEEPKNNPKSVVDSNHRYCGFGMKATNRWVTQSTPGPLAKWWMRDNPPPELAASLNISQMYVLWRDAWNTV